jgi:hypothetical protein
VLISSSSVRMITDTAGRGPVQGGVMAASGLGNVGCVLGASAASASRLSVRSGKLTPPTDQPLSFDTSRPDGTPRKLLDSSKLIEMGWRARTSLREGLKLTYSDFIARSELSTTQPNLEMI